MPKGLITWGDQWLGSLGNGQPAAPETPQPTPAAVPVPPVSGDLAGWTPIGGSDIPSHAFLHEGVSVAPVGWGWNAYNQVQPTHLPFGTAYSDSRAVLVPETITSDVGLAMACGSAHTILIALDGTLYAWGNNGFGQCGQDPTAYPIASGAQVGSPPPGDFVDVTAGEDASFLLRAGADPGIYGLGRFLDDGTGNAYSSNNLLSTPVPTLLPSQPADVLALSKPGGAALAWFAISGSARLVWGWGYNRYGTVGNGESFNDSTGLLYVFAPVAVLGVGGSGQLSGVQMLASCYDKAAALMDDGSVVAWGEGVVPADGSASKHPVALPATPSPVLDLTVTASAIHVVCADGGVYAMGYNGAGQLGIGTVDNDWHPTWVRALGITGATKIAASWSSLYCIGEVTLARRAFPSQHLG